MTQPADRSHWGWCCRTARILGLDNQRYPADGSRLTLLPLRSIIKASGRGSGLASARFHGGDPEPRRQGGRDSPLLISDSAFLGF